MKKVRIFIVIMLCLIFISNLIFASEGVSGFEFSKDGEFYSITSHKSIYYGLIPQVYYSSKHNWDSILNFFGNTNVIEPVDNLYSKFVPKIWGGGATTEDLSLDSQKYVLYTGFTDFSPVTALNYLRGIDLIIELLTAKVENSYKIAQEDKSKLIKLIKNYQNILNIQKKKFIFTKTF